MAPYSSTLLLLFMILLISLHHLLQVHSQHNLSSQQTHVLLSLNHLWGNPFSLYDDNPLQWNPRSSLCFYRQYVTCTDDMVTGLSLSQKNINGTIPSSLICQLKYLVSIDLSRNYISGSIPSGLRNCSSLQTLDLSSNDLSGTIPDELFLMESLVTLSLGGNNLSGIIPTTIGKAFSLQSLDLSNNYNLNGSIPDGVTYLHNLAHLDLSGNSFSGEIPGEIFLMESLVTLSLGGNNLSGIIPTTIGKAFSLQSLDLSNNYNLNGSIPDGVTYLHNLAHFDFSRNSFSGEIPSGLFSIHRLKYLSLGYNYLSGQLPSYIDLQTLKYLNLTHNRLSGPILKSFGGKTNGVWSYLDLSDNQLYGEIAYISLNLTWLEDALNLCNNKFSGTVPFEFVIHHFQDYCLDPSNLCTAEGTNESLPSCPSSLCSYDIFQYYSMCVDYKHKKSHSIIMTAVGIAAAAAAGFGVVFAVIYYLARKCNQVLKSDPSMKEEEEWKLVSFQGLNFKTTDILSSLTDENLIGNGGSGKVYRVFNNLKMNYVAVKSISISRISDLRAEKEFLAEIQTLGVIWHCNIMKLLGYISGPGLKLLVYEYSENKSLDRWVHGSTKLDWPTRMNIAIGAAQGLCYMHHHCPIPIIHRDIKSSNILLDSEFNAKIADFGLAKLLNTGGDTQTASTVAGTFGYIAPEYAYTSKVNAKSDVYSFGVVLLELTTGRKAVTRGDHLNLGGWAHLQCKDASSTFDALDGEIKETSIYLDQIISVFRLGVVCTAALPSSRPSMKDCLHILQNCSNNATTSAPC